MPVHGHVDSAPLEFAEDTLMIGGETDIRTQLSAVALDGDSLWLACDEGCRLERLSRSGSRSFAAHQVFPLESLLELPAASKEEADIEGLFVDEGWLWLVGSHSVKRKKPKGESPSEIAGQLRKTRRDGNRHLLARVPLVGNELKKKDGARTAAALDATDTSSALLDAIRAENDPHLGPFLNLPGKDNGFDIEGLAANGMRVWVGLRGPVLREWCCVLELQLESDGNRLELVASNDGSYRKHFLKLDGLGVRDLLVLGDDLLILAGPSMAHDGPSGIWRWKNGVKANALATPADVSRVIALPQLERKDRPEGMTLFEPGASSTSVLVVFDTPSAERLVGPATVLADIYRLP